MTAGGIGILVLLAVLLIEGLGQLLDIVAVVAVLGEGYRVLPQDDLEVAGLQRGGKLLDLVAGVVDVELPPHIGTGGLQHGGQGVPQHAAPGIAHVHGAGGVGGDKLHHDLLALEGVAAAVGCALALHGGQDLPVPLLRQTEVEETCPGNLRRGKVTALQVQILQQNPGDFPGAFLHGLGGGQGKGGGVIAVGRVLGDLHIGPDLHVGRELSGGHSGLVGGVSEGQDLVLGLLDHMDHIVCLPISRTRILN